MQASTQVWAMVHGKVIGGAFGAYGKALRGEVRSLDEASSAVAAALGMSETELEAIAQVRPDTAMDDPFLVA